MTWQTILVTLILAACVLHAGRRILGKWRRMQGGCGQGCHDGGPGDGTGGCQDCQLKDNCKGVKEAT